MGLRLPEGSRFGSEETHSRSHHNNRDSHHYRTCRCGSRRNVLRPLCHADCETDNHNGDGPSRRNHKLFGLHGSRFLSDLQRDLQLHHATGSSRYQLQQWKTVRMEFNPDGNRDFHLFHQFSHLHWQRDRAGEHHSLDPRVLHRFGYRSIHVRYHCDSRPWREFHRSI